MNLTTLFTCPALRNLFLSAEGAVTGEPGVEPGESRAEPQECIKIDQALKERQKTCNNTQVVASPLVWSKKLTSSTISEHCWQVLIRVCRT